MRRSGDAGGLCVCVCVCVFGGLQKLLGGSKKMCMRGRKLKKKYKKHRG